MITILASWTWVKKHWQIVLEGIGILLAFLFGFEAKRRPVVVTGVDPVKTKVENQTAVAIQQAQVQHDTVVAQDQAQATAATAAVVKTETTETAKVEDSVDATNAYLQGVSKDLQGPTGGAS